MQPAITETKEMAMPLQRSQLHEILPLDTPYSLHIFPSYFCNFKCSYCLHSLQPDALERMGFRKRLMSFGVYKKAIDDLQDFPEKLRALIFAGHGEPLIHKEIDKMVHYAKARDVAERVEVVTNGALLSPELSDRLIFAGIDRLRISLQGLSRKKYKDVSDVDMDFDRFIENVRYFHSRKGRAELYVKIIDIALEDKEEESRFRTLFSEISDMASIEYTIPFVPQVDYSKFGVEFTKCKQGHEKKATICAMPFYMLVLTPGGDVVPCCSVDIPIIYGNVREKSLFDLWNDSRMRRFLRLQIANKDSNPVCRKCSVPAYGLQEGDYLDEHREKLAGLFE